MYEAKHISSTQNALIKKIVLLRDKSKERKKTGLFILEGKRELELALKGGYSIATLLYNEKRITASELQTDFNKIAFTNIISVSQEVYNKLAYRNTTEGLIAVATAKPHHLEELKFNTKK